MISSLVGAVIMSAATVAMLVAIQITNRTLKSVGKNPISQDEKEMILNAGYNEKKIDLLNEDIELLDFE